MRIHPQEIAIRRWMIGLMIGGLVLFVVCPAIEPIQTAMRYHQDLLNVEASTRSIERENQALAKQILWMRTPEGMSVIARENGYRTPNEIVIRVKKGKRASPRIAMPTDSMLPSALPKPIE